jgi:hypothetical protein
MHNKLIAMAFGLIGTIVFHISKGMQQHGIEILKHISHILLKKTKPGTLYLKKKTIIYTSGVFLNNTVGIWIILANRFAPASYYTSMYGVGLIALMIYSSKILKDDLNRSEYIGSALVVIGTLVLGIEGVFRKNVIPSAINEMTVVYLTIIFFAVSIGMLLFVFNRKSSLHIGIAFGIITGGCASLDPIYKYIGQSLGGSSRFLPHTTVGIIFFIISFIFTTGAFLMTQYAFSKHAQATVLVSIQNCIYVILPIIIQAIALNGFIVTVFTIFGMIMVTSGIIIMRFYMPARNKQSFVSS